jgi:hypothetical protein
VQVIYYLQCTLPFIQKTITLQELLFGKCLYPNMMHIMKFRHCLKCPFNHVLYHKNSKASHLYQKQPHIWNALFSQSFDYKCKDNHWQYHHKHSILNSKRMSVIAYALHFHMRKSSICFFLLASSMCYFS